jgi:signal transduction histidine kinase
LEDQHPHSNDGHELSDPARLHLIADTGLIEASTIARLPTLDRLARVAARAVRAPLGQVNIVTDDHQIPVAAFVEEGAPGPAGASLDARQGEIDGEWRTPVGLEASYCQHVVRNGAPMIVEDARTDPRVAANKGTTDAGIRSYVGAPVVAPNGDVLGTVCVVDFKPRSWTGADVAALVECAALAGEEVSARLGAAQVLQKREGELREARDRAEAARERLARLQTLTAALSAAVSSDDIARAVVAHAAAVVDAVGVMFIRPAANDMLEMAYVSDLPADIAVKWARFPLSADIPLAEAARTRMPIFLASREEWQARFPHALPQLDAAGHHANAVAPIIAGEHLLGVIAVAYDAPRSFDEGDRALFLTVAEQCGQALERARLLDAERDAREEAERANRAKTEFLAMMSHELRTPLNAIGGYAQIIEMEVHGSITDAQRQDLQRIQHSQRHLLGLINEVLNFTRLETGQVRYDLHPVQVSDVFASTTDFIAPQARQKAIALAMHCAEDTMAMADEPKLKQVLVNLLSNAIKFTEPGGRIDVDCAPDAKGECVAITVRDSGIGIPAGKLREIFEPFVQVRAGLTRTAEGVGLGLAISRDLARGMHGDITVTSVPNEGSTFTLTLPVARGGRRLR